MKHLSARGLLCALLAGSVISAARGAAPNTGVATPTDHAPSASTRPSARSPGRGSQSDSAVLPYTKINPTPSTKTDSTGPRVSARPPSAAFDPRQQRSPHQVLLDRVNYYRKRAGVAPVMSDWRLRKSAQSHADYLSNAKVIGHFEYDTANAYYTGEDPYRRINAAGYAFTQAGEVIAKINSHDLTVAVDHLMDAVYHRFVILSSDLTHAGAAAGRKARQDSDTTEVTIDFASPSAPTARGSALIVYPAREQPNIPPAFDATTEIPNPMTGYGLVGAPVSVQADSGLQLTVDTFRLSAVNGVPANGAAPDEAPISEFVAAKLLVHDLDADTPPWAAALIPERPLLPHTVYRVEFSGTVDGSAVSQIWTFTTADR